MKRALIVLFVLAPVAVLLLLPLYTIGAFAAVVWYSLAVGWGIGVENFRCFVTWGRKATTGRER